ncbi:MAG: hypothetical protein ABJB74_21620, partial [Gemmatimonas sp.]
MRITRLIAGVSGAVLFATSVSAQQPPAGGGRGGGGGGGRGGAIAIQPGEQCPAGMTEIRPKSCLAPQSTPPSILDYRPQS